MKRTSTAGLLLLTLLLTSCGGQKVLVLYPADFLLQKDEEGKKEEAAQATPLAVDFSSQDAYELFPDLPPGIGENVDEWLSVAQAKDQDRKVALTSAASWAYSRLAAFLMGPNDSSYSLIQPKLNVFRVDYKEPLHMAIVIVTAPKHLNPKHLGKDLMYDDLYWYAKGSCTSRDKEYAEERAKKEALRLLTNFILNGKFDRNFQPKAVEKSYCSSRYDGTFWHVQVILGALRRENPRM